MHIVYNEINMQKEARAKKRNDDWKHFPDFDDDELNLRTLHKKIMSFVIDA